MNPKQSAANPVCMGCQVTMATPLFCFSCNSLQRLSHPPNYFEIFNLPYTYELNLAELETQYQQLAMELHPDFYLNAPKAEKQQSQESSTLLNQAYTVLKSPLSRATYLLKLLRQNTPLDQNQLPKGFLEEIFETQETLEDLLAAGNQSAEVASFQAEIQEQMAELQKKITQAFAQIEAGAAHRDSLLSKIQEHLNVGRYFQTLLDRIARSTSL